MDRRNLLAVAGVLALAESAIAKSDPKAKSNAKMGSGKSAAGTIALAIQQQVLKTTNDCQLAGEVCAAHCIRLLSEGDKSMAACMVSVQNMLAATNAVFQLANLNNVALETMQSIAKACADLCQACSKECSPHVDHHEFCKNCKQACDNCIKACEALAA